MRTKCIIFGETLRIRVKNFKQNLGKKYAKSSKIAIAACIFSKFLRGSVPPDPPRAYASKHPPLGQAYEFLPPPETCGWLRHCAPATAVSAEPHTHMLHVYLKIKTKNIKTFVCGGEPFEEISPVPQPAFETPAVI